MTRVPPSEALLEGYAPIRPIEPGSPIRAHRATNVFTLWAAWEAEAGGEQDVPYWAVPWPAGLVLARYILARPDVVRAKLVVDLGCGGAVEAIAACLAGARQTVANDLDPVALGIAKRNVTANGLRLELSQQDFTREPAESQPDVVLVADLFYERESAARLLNLLHEWRAAGVEVILADAGRRYSPKTGIEVLACEQVTVDADLEGVPVRTVRLMRLCG